MSFQGINLGHKFKYILLKGNWLTTIAEGKWWARQCYPTLYPGWHPQCHDRPENTWQQTADIPETTVHLNSTSALAIPAPTPRSPFCWRQVLALLSPASSRHLRQYDRENWHPGVTFKTPGSILETPPTSAFSPPSLPHSYCTSYKAGLRVSCLPISNGKVSHLLLSIYVLHSV